MSSDLLDFEVGQGETFKILLHIYTENTGSSLVDITDYTFDGQLRENYTTDEVAANFTVEKLTPYTSGSVYVSLTSTDTSALDQRYYVYDVRMLDNSNPPVVRRLLEGQFTVRPSVTR
jgi:hypothetical protein